MISRIRQWWRRRAADGRAVAARQVGQTTRVLLEAGHQHARAARGGAHPTCQWKEAYHLAAEFYGRVGRRRPDLAEAREAEALCLLELALRSMQRGDEALVEWVSAVVTLGRHLSEGPPRPLCLCARAALFLAQGTRLRSRGESARPCLVQAGRDLDRALRLIPANPWPEALTRAYHQMRQHEATAAGPLPSISDLLPRPPPLPVDSPR